MDLQRRIIDRIEYLTMLIDEYEKDIKAMHDDLATLKEMMETLQERKKYKWEH